MCGIVGYIGPKQAAPLILEALKKLEYRGYDSSGIAVADGNKLGVVKAKGRLSVLEEMTDGGIPLAEPDPEPTEDWLTLIAAADSEDALAAVAARLAEKGEGTDKIRAAYRARSAVLSTEANTVDAEVVEDTQTPVEGAPPSDSPTAAPSAGPDTEADYEAAAAAEFDAAVAAGEVTGG